MRCVLSWRSGAPVPARRRPVPPSSPIRPSRLRVIANDRRGSGRRRPPGNLTGRRVRGHGRSGRAGTVDDRDSAVPGRIRGAGAAGGVPGGRIHRRRWTRVARHDDGHRLRTATPLGGRQGRRPTPWCRHDGGGADRRWLPGQLDQRADIAVRRAGPTDVPARRPDRMRCAARVPTPACPAAAGGRLAARSSATTGRAVSVEATDNGLSVDLDGRARCRWGASRAEYIDYHDTEWGVPLHGDDALFERLCLEAFQSGLSWLTILQKRPAFRRAFDDFRIERVADFDDSDVARLLADASIVRNRAKIEACIHNARAAADLDHGLDALLWSFAPTKGRSRPATIQDIVAITPESTAMAKALKDRGFRFVGPTTAHALMQASGMVDDHLVGCWRAAGPDRMPGGA